MRQYIWKEDKVQEFQGILIQLWEREWSALKPGENMEKLNGIIREAARRTGMITKRKAKREQSWFYSDCRDKRKEV